MAQTVADTLVGVLERIGVRQIFALIGASLNPLADAVQRSSIEWIGVPACERGIKFLNPDFVASARACGGHGFAACKPGELKITISEALAVQGPAIVDAAIVDNEIPNLPHLDIELLGHVALAKIKEAVLAVTGG